MAEFESSLAGDAFFSEAPERLRKLFNALSSSLAAKHFPEIVDELGDWKPPCIVVFGSESCGKSTIIKRLTGLDILPVGDNICTRLPIKVEVRSSPSSHASHTIHKAKVEVWEWDAEEDEDKQGQRLRKAWKPENMRCVSTTVIDGPLSSRNTQTNILDEVSKVLERENTAIGNGVSQDSMITLRIWGNEFPSIDFLDMPGLVVNPGPNEPTDMAKQTIRCLWRSLKLVGIERCVLLAVRRVADSLRESQSVRFIQESLNANEIILENTICVLTKADEVSSEVLKQAIRQGFPIAGCKQFVTMSRPDVAGGPLENTFFQDAHVDAEFINSSSVNMGIISLWQEIERVYFRLITKKGQRLPKLVKRACKNVSVSSTASSQTAMLPFQSEDEVMHGTTAFESDLKFVCTEAFGQTMTSFFGKIDTMQNLLKNISGVFPSSQTFGVTELAAVPYNVMEVLRENVLSQFRRVLASNIHRLVSSDLVASSQGKAPHGRAGASTQSNQRLARFPCLRRALEELAVANSNDNLELDLVERPGSATNVHRNLVSCQQHADDLISAAVTHLITYRLMPRIQNAETHSKTLWQFSQIAGVDFDCHGFQNIAQEIVAVMTMKLHTRYSQWINQLFSLLKQDYIDAAAQDGDAWWQFLEEDDSRLNAQQNQGDKAEQKISLASEIHELLYQSPLDAITDTESSDDDSCTSQPADERVESTSKSFCEMPVLPPNDVLRNDRILEKWVSDLKLCVDKGASAFSVLQEIDRFLNSCTGINISVAATTLLSILVEYLLLSQHNDDDVASISASCLLRLIATLRQLSLQAMLPQSDIQNLMTEASIQWSNFLASNPTDIDLSSASRTGHMSTICAMVLAGVSDLNFLKSFDFSTDGYSLLTAAEHCIEAHVPLLLQLWILDKFPGFMHAADVKARRSSGLDVNGSGTIDSLLGAMKQQSNDENFVSDMKEWLLNTDDSNSGSKGRWASELRRGFWHDAGVGESECSRIVSCLDDSQASDLMNRLQANGFAVEASCVASKHPNVLKTIMNSKGAFDKLASKGVNGEDSMFNLSALVKHADRTANGKWSIQPSINEGTAAAVIRHLKLQMQTKQQDPVFLDALKLLDISAFLQHIANSFGGMGSSHDMFATTLSSTPSGNLDNLSQELLDDLLDLFSTAMHSVTAKPGDSQVFGSFFSSWSFAVKLHWKSCQKCKKRFSRRVCCKQVMRLDNSQMVVIMAESQKQPSPIKDDLEFLLAWMETSTNSEAKEPRQW